MENGLGEGVIPPGFRDSVSIFIVRRVISGVEIGRGGRGGGGGAAGCGAVGVGGRGEIGLGAKGGGGVGADGRVEGGKGAGGFWSEKGLVSISFILPYLI